MSDPISLELAESVTAWVRAQAGAIQVAAKVRPEGVTLNGDWLDVPVSLDAEGDAYDHAVLLQKIEDAWQPADHDGLRLFLRSTGGVPSKEDDYRELGGLMQRQHAILDRMAERGITEEDAAQFQRVRREWETLLDEMERRYPSLKNEAA